MSDDIPPDRMDPDRSRFVVPDPASPPEGEPTTFIPPAPPPAIDQHWSAPTTQQPATTQYPVSPPTAPPQQWGDAAGSAVPVGGWGPTQPGGSQQPSQYPPSQYPPSQYPPSQYPPSQYPPAPHPGAQQAKKSGRAAAIVIGVLIVVLVALGAFFGFRALNGSTGTFEGTVDQCHIAADGTLTSQGTITSGDAVDTTLEVRFDDVANGEEVDRTLIDVSGPADEPLAWSATGHAPDDVNRVTCTMGPAD